MGRLSPALPATVLKMIPDRSFMESWHRASRETQWLRLRTALLNYRKLNGDFDIPATFTVPMGSLLWPKKTWGMKLGLKIQCLQDGRTYKNQHEFLTKIGFDLLSKYERRYIKVKSALLAYKSIYGTLDVPRHFIVPSTPDWPKSTWNMRLGWTLKSIRTMGTFASKRGNESLIYR
jgi:hypothetical protein